MIKNIRNALIAILLPLLSFALYYQYSQYRLTKIDVQDAYIAEAEKLLDSWQGKHHVLDEAYEKVRIVLEANPRHSHAHLQLARYYLMDGYISGENYEPEAMQRAMAEAFNATQLDPTNVKAQIKLGWILTKNNRHSEADRIYQNLEPIVKDNPGMYVEWANALWMMDQNVRAKEMVLKAKLDAEKAHKDTDTANACNLLLKIYQTELNLDGMENCYKQLIQLKPDMAWRHGNYALFLLEYRGDVDAAIEKARDAIKIMPYGNAYQTLSASLLTKWAVLNESDPDAARVAYKEHEAIGLAPDFLYGVLVHVGDNLPLQTLMEVLLSKGYEIDESAEKGETPFIGSLSSHLNSSTKWLLEHGANVNQVAKEGGRSALHYAIANEDMELVKLLLQYKADPNVVDSAQLSPFHYAVSNNSVEIAKLLQELGADIHAKASYGRTPLWIAAAGNSKEAVEYLIKNKADVNAAGDAGDTPLMMAAGNGNREMVDLLLAAGARIEPRMSNKQNAADIADFNKFKDIGDYLRERENKFKEQGKEL